MPFQWQVKQLGSILRGRGVHQCLVIATSCPTAAAAREASKQSLTKAGIRFTELEMEDQEWPTVETVENAVFESRELAAQAVVGMWVHRHTPQRSSIPREAFLRLLWIAAARTGCWMRRRPAAC